MTIRRIPSDFEVSERLTKRFAAAILPEQPKEQSNQSRIVLYAMSKRSLTTPEATQRLAKSFHVKPGAIEYAGLKDKHAETLQFITVAPEPTTRIGDIHGENLNAKFIGFVPEHIRAADIDRNYFKIVVRDASDAAAREMIRRGHLLTVPAGTLDTGRRLVFVNYFGDQRFGSARHGKGWVAAHLVKGEFDQALRLAIGTPARKDSGAKRTFTRLCATHWGDWKRLATELPKCPEKRAIETLAAGKPPIDAFAALPYFTQQICVEAFQSHLWNDTARRLVEHMAAGASHTEVCRADDPFGEMVFPAPRRIDPLLRDLQLPMLAPETRLSEPWASAAAETLAAENLRLEDLRIPGLRRPAFGEADRPLFVEASAFTISKPEPDNLSRGKRLKLILEFELPRGAYATVLLRALGQ